MNRIVCHHFSVRRFALPMFVAFWAVGALAIPAVAQQDDEAKVQECWDVMRQYARHVNQGDLTAAYKLLAPPVADLVTESDFREFLTLQATKGSLFDDETDRSLAELGLLTTDLILAIEKPEVEGRDAIAGLIVAQKPLWQGDLGSWATISGDYLKLRDPEFVRSHKLPPWGDQLRDLGLSPEDCDLVDNLDEVLGDPESAYWPIKKEWVVASLDKDGQWRVWPPLQHARLLGFTGNVVTRQARYELIRDPYFLAGFGPWVSPKPSMTGLTYVRWSAVETDPAKCPKCGKYVQQDWEYCPYDGTKLKHDKPETAQPDGAGDDRGGESAPQ